MSSYRRAEPAYCRGCGARWSSGADACGACGESIEAPPVVGGDPRAVPKLWRALGVVGAVLAARWTVALFLSGSDDEIADPAALYAVLELPGLLAVLTARWWYPTGLAAPLGGRPAVRAWVAAPILGLALAAAAFGLQGELLGYVEVGAEPGLWVALLIASIVAQELLLRGLLFDGVAAIGGRINAAIASVLVFGLFSLDPFALLFAAGAAGLRGWSGSVLPGILLRLVATLALLAACGAFG